MNTTPSLCTPISIPPLQGNNNWSQWSMRTRALLAAEGLVDRINSRTDDPSDRDNGRALTLIYSSIADSQFTHLFSKLTSAHEVWKILEIINGWEDDRGCCCSLDCGEYGLKRRFKRLLDDIVYEEGKESMYMYVARAKAYQYRLKELGNDVSNRDVVRNLGNGLPRRFDQAATSHLRLVASKVSLESIANCLAEMEDALQHGEVGSHEEL